MPENREPVPVEVQVGRCMACGRFIQKDAVICKPCGDDEDRRVGESRLP
jgi:rRNA maturation endonuclease Nob1